MKGKPKITRSEKQLFFVTGFALIFILAFGAWRQWADAIPNVQIPTPKMPSPNAYNFYVKAGASIVAANPAVDPVHDRRSVPKAQWKSRYPTSAKEAWLRQNATALNLLRQGFKHPSRVPPKRSFNTTDFKHYAGFRAMARMLSIESHARSERGNWHGAVQSKLDALQMGYDIFKGGVLVDNLVGIAVNAIGRHGWWEILPHLNASEAKSAARRLEKILKNRASYADVIREEKYFGQAGLLEMMKSNEWRTMDLNEATGLKRLIERWQMLKTPNRVVLNNHMDYMDSLISHFQKPYNTKMPDPAIPDDFYNQALTIPFSSARFNNARDEAAKALFLAALSLRAYRLENNRYPQTLNQLVPRYLKKISADPFGGGEPLHYKLSGTEYSLYSIGPDRIDNNGRAIEDTKVPKGKRRRFLTQPESKGDFVAGVNH